MSDQIHSGLLTNSVEVRFKDVSDLIKEVAKAKKEISRLLLDNEGYSMTEKEIADTLNLDASLVGVALYSLTKEGNFNIQKSYRMLRSETVQETRNPFALGGK